VPRRADAPGREAAPRAARDLQRLLALAVRASAGRGPHAEAARNVVLAILLAQLLAGAGHEGPPHAARRAPRHARPARHRLPHRDTLAGRRPRG
jgi:hypothetical protein